MHVTKFFESINARLVLRGRFAGGRFTGDESGAILVLGVFLFAVMFLVGGIAVDMMRYESERVRLQGTADRAVLAATMMRDNPGGATPQEIVQAYFDAEGLGDTVRGRIQVTETAGGRTVTVAPRTTVATNFLRFANVDRLDMNLMAAATEGLAEISLEIVMVLDVSGSMRDFNRIENLRIAATDFVSEMLADNDNGRVAITFVPYSTEVIMPAGTLGYFNNLDDPLSGSMHNAFCIDFHTWDSVTDSINAPMFRRNCDLRSNTSYLITDMPIRPFLSDVDEAIAYINTLGPNWGTSIDLGLRAGAMFFDPTLRPVINHLVDADQIDDVFRDRPLNWQDPTSFRALILMTDGENCCFHPGHAATRKPSLEIQDADTISVCNALKARGVVIYGVAFEAPPGGEALMAACASSPSHFYNSSGTALLTAFQNIATHIQTQSLRLIQ